MSEFEIGDSSTTQVRMLSASYFRGRAAYHEIFIGPNAGPTGLTAGVNIGIGAYALANTGVGSKYMVALGDSAMMANVSGWDSVAIGNRAMLKAVSVIDCTAVGSEAMASVIDGVGGTAVGRLALQKATSALNNSGFGDSALRFTTNGVANVAVGYRSAETNTTGSRNVSVGAHSSLSLTSGDSNVMVGSNAGNHPSQKIDAINSIAVGEGTHTTADNQAVIGNSLVDTFVLGGVTITKAQLLGLLALLP